jgi:hypothetical protein
MYQPLLVLKRMVARYRVYPTTFTTVAVGPPPDLAPRRVTNISPPDLQVFVYGGIPLCSPLAENFDSYSISDL